jgi:Sporulation and spore germination
MRQPFRRPTAQPMPVTRAPVVALILAVAVAVVGCAIPDQHTPVAIGTTPPASHPSATQPHTPSPSLVDLFMVQGKRLAVVHRSTNPALGAILTSLLAGPTNQETAAGLTSAIPAGTELDSAILVGATARLDFTDSLASVSGQEEVLAFAQIVTTATSLPGVERVQIAIDGQMVNAPLSDGTLAQGPVDRADYIPLLPP